DSQGCRMLPTRTKKKDEEFVYRVDQGEFFDDGTYNVVMQKNGDPHGPIVARTRVDPRVDTGDDVIARLRESFT
ncbi:hypothetical protein BDQ17DRAFT_1252121, partial [Cyathus striatus]